MVYLFLAEGFEESEAVVTLDILRRAGCEVRSVGVGGVSVTGAHGICVRADMAETDAETDALEAVVMPGGMPGTLNLEKSPVVRACIEACAENGGLLCAICAAPSILGHLGLLNGHEAVCFPGFESELKGAHLCVQAVVRSGNIITSRGAGTVFQFALAVAEALAGTETAKKISAAVCFE